MNMHASLPAPANPPESNTFGRVRSDGWTPDRQRAFLEAIAQGATVEAACRHVGMSTAAAYALRNRAAGSAFALGWRAATLVARDHVADTLLTRAIDGQVETWTRADGATVSRHKYDNRLAGQLLARLDRLADARAGEGTHHAARIVAQDFDAFLDLVEGEAAPARAGLFLMQRAAGELSPDLAPIAALARADCWLRTGAANGGQVATADLDPADRAGWTAEQWARAEAAGLLALAPAPAPRQSAREPLLPPLPYPDDPDRGPVWWCDLADAYRTCFPPPEEFDDYQQGEYGDDEYERALTPEEEAAVEAPWRAEVAARRVVEEVARNVFFAECAEVPLPDQGGAGGGSGAGETTAEEAEEGSHATSPPPAKPVSSDGSGDPPAEPDRSMCDFPGP